MWSRKVISFLGSWLLSWVQSGCQRVPAIKVTKVLLVRLVDFGYVGSVHCGHINVSGMHFMKTNCLK